MHATDSYYEKRIATLEERIQEVRELAIQWARHGIPHVPVSDVLDILDKP